MPDQKPDAAAALKKLGQHVRQGFAKKHPIPEKSLDTVRDAVREEWEKEKKAEREQKPAPDEPKKRDGREPHEPDREI